MLNCTKSAEIYNIVTNSASEFTKHKIYLVILRVLTSDSIMSAGWKLSPYALSLNIKCKM